MLATLPIPAVAPTASAVAAIPNLDARSAFISSGTWSLMGVELDGPVTSEQARELGFTNEGGCGGSTLLMRNITGLWILQECLRQWEKEGKGCGWDELIAAAKAAERNGRPDWAWRLRTGRAAPAPNERAIK